MFKQILIIPLLLTLCLQFTQAQTSIIIKGSVVDSITNTPLFAVNIFDQDTYQGTFTDADGQFTLTIKNIPTTIVFSFIGYENYFLKVDSVSTEGFIIALKQNILRLPSAEVIAQPKVEKLTKPIFTVKDFLIKDDKILLVKFGGLTVGDYLELRDLDGHIIHSLPIDVKGVVENMHQSCLGNIHLLGTKEVIEVDIGAGRIKLVSKYSRVDFDRYLKPCVEASEEYLYYKQSRYRGQEVRFDFISKKERSIKNRVVISDQENIYRMFEELGNYNTAENYFSAATANPDPNIGISRPEVLDAWIGIFFKPLFSPLYNTGEEICLFNHTSGLLRFYTFDGQLKRQLPINYHQEKKWDTKILKDEKTGKFYTAYKDMIGKKFYEINLKTGTISPAFKVKCAFVEKMIIYDGYLYYQDSDVVPGKVNRILHKVKVN